MYMQEQSETSLILKTEMKHPEMKKNLPRNPGFQRQGKKLNTSPSIQWPLSLTIVTRSSQTDRASSSEAACVLTGHNVCHQGCLSITHTVQNVMILGRFWAGNHREQNIDRA